MKKIFFWSPMISNVGTVKATINSALAISIYSQHKIYLLNIIGEFNLYQNELKKKNIIIINFFFSSFSRFLPQTGFFSKFFIYSITLISLPKIFFYLFKIRPHIFITSLVGYIPLFFKFFFKKIKIFNSIQGYPNFNIMRTLIWKLFYKKSDYLLTMTNKTKQLIHDKIKVEKDKILVIENPVISRNIKMSALEEIDYNEKFIFEKKVYCAIGRLTKQKNFFELLKGLKKYSDDTNDNFNLIILGEGELRDELSNYIKKNNLHNFYLLGYKSNPYKYLYRSDLYICTSLWEEPGHTLIESGYLNVPVLSSNCPNGPDEIIIDGYNGLKYKLGNINDFLSKLKLFNTLSLESKKLIKLNLKKIVRNYTKFKFYKSISKILI
jgi:glycosyltransferase involved in cell wall biosynthesis